IFYLDQLTGVENKKGLIRQFAKYQDEGIKFDLYYMDINKFKQINDTLGHNVGDIAIIESVHAIRDYANNNSGFAYRIGGDEFAMLTTSNKTEEQIIKDIKDIIKKPIKYNADGKSGVLELSISIGRANIIKDDDVKIKQVIQSADKNMYKDKTK
ncbi:MAG: putative diguanylate cyclase YfiN, partial [Proteobacteria bacterium]